MKMQQFWNNRTREVFAFTGDRNILTKIETDNGV
jgi:hypothetical protein